MHGVDKVLGGRLVHSPRVLQTISACVSATPFVRGRAHLFDDGSESHERTLESRARAMVWDLLIDSVSDVFLTDLSSV